MRSGELPDRICDVLRSARTLPSVLAGVVAVGLAGSYARGTARADSDVDLVVLTTQVKLALDRSDWFAIFGPGPALIRSADFGAIQERRLRLADGTVVEVGVASPRWASTDPVDAGTLRVVSDGFGVLHDPDGLLARLVRTVGNGFAQQAAGKLDECCNHPGR